MKEDNISNRVKHIIAKYLDVEEEKVKESSDLVDDLGADSLDTVELILQIEEEFAVEIPDEVGENIKTVQDIISFLKKK